MKINPCSPLAERKKKNNIKTITIVKENENIEQKGEKEEKEGKETEALIPS